MATNSLLGLDALDPRKMVELVEKLWEQRETIPRAVGLVWENRDALIAAAKFVSDHGEDLLRLLTALPRFAGLAGEAMEKAGAGARTAARFLLGDEDEPGGVQVLVSVASDALERCRDELNAVTRVFNAFGDHVDSIKIPSFEPRFSEVAGFRVITGIDVGQLPLTDQAAHTFRAGAGRLGAIADDLGTVADRMRGLGKRLGGTGGDLASMGEELASSGVALMGLAGSAVHAVMAPIPPLPPKPAPTPPIPRTPAAATPPNPAAETAATRKAAAPTKKAAAPPKKTTKKTAKKAAAPEKPSKKKAAKTKTADREKPSKKKAAAPGR